MKRKPRVSRTATTKSRVPKTRFAGDRAIAIGIVQPWGALCLCCFVEELQEGAHGGAAMAQSALFGGVHLGERLVVAARHEDRVEAEAAGAGGLVRDAARAGSLEGVELARRVGVE